MVQCAKALATHAWKPEFDPWNPCKGERREPAPQSRPLTSIHSICTVMMKGILIEKTPKSEADHNYRS